MSDAMCAKTTETSRCQRCGSEFDWLSDGTKIHAGKQYFESDSLLCLERQLNAANAKIKWLEEAFNAAEGLIAVSSCGCPYGDEVFHCSSCIQAINRYHKAKENKP